MTHTCRVADWDLEVLQNKTLVVSVSFPLQDQVTQFKTGKGYPGDSLGSSSNLTSEGSQHVLGLKGAHTCGDCKLFL